MKSFIFIIVVAALLAGAWACAKSPSKPIENPVEQMPEFPGGQAGLLRFLNANIIYPAEAAEKGVEGKVVVQFVVEIDGSVGEVKVIRSTDPLLDAEAVRVCKSLPLFTPGRQNGKPVCTWFTMPVTFKLSAPEPAEDITQ